MDSKFSHELLGGAAGYQLQTGGKDASEEVDEVELYCSHGESSFVYTVEDIRRLERVYTATDRKVIRDLMMSARSAWGKASCPPYRGLYVVHVLAFDRGRMRVGSFTYTKCPGKIAGVIQAYNINSVAAAPNMDDFLTSHKIQCGPW